MKIVVLISALYKFYYIIILLLNAKKSSPQITNNDLLFWDVQVLKDGSDVFLEREHRH